MPAQIAIIHGWSDSSKSFHDLRDYLVAHGYEVAQVWLGDYVSMEDDVRIEDVGKRMGIRDGDEIWLETSVRKAKAFVKLTQCVHPEVVGIAGHFGHWAKGMPIAHGKGIAYNPLLPNDLNSIDKISTALDNCALIRITKVRRTDEKGNAH